MTKRPDPNPPSTPGQPVAKTRTSDLGTAINHISSEQAKKAYQGYLAKYRALRNKEAAEMSARGAWQEAFSCSSNISSLYGGNSGGPKSRDWLCKIDNQLRYRESKYSTASTNLRVFVEGAEVTPYIEGSVSWSIQSTGGMNTCSFTLNNSEDQFVVTPANVCAGLDITGWRIFVDKNKQAVSDYATIGWNTDESAKYQIYKHKWNKVFKNPASPEIDETGMWLYPLTPYSCIFNKHDCVRIFVRLAHVTGAYGLDDVTKKKDYTDLWVPAFSGFIDAYDFEDDAVTGKRTVHVKAYDYRGLLDRMRVRMEGNPTGSETKLGELKEGAGIANYLAKSVKCLVTHKWEDESTNVVSQLTKTANDPIPRPKYLELLNKYGLSALLIEIFTNAFECAGREAEIQEGRLDEATGQRAVSKASQRITVSAQKLVCAIFTFNDKVIDIRQAAKTSLKFTIDVDPSNSFRLQIDSAALDTDTSTIKKLQADSSPPGGMYKFANDIDGVVAWYRGANSTDRWNLFYGKIQVVNKSNEAWLKLNGSTGITVAKNTSASATQLSYLDNDITSTDINATIKQSAAIVSKVLSAYYNALSPAAKTSVQPSDTLSNALPGWSSSQAFTSAFVSAGAWEELFKDRKALSILSNICSKTTSWAKKASDTGSGDTARLITELENAVREMNITSDAAKKDIAEWQALTRKYKEELTGVKNDIKENNRSGRALGKILDARSNNDSNRGTVQGYNAAGKPIVVTDANKDVMSKADLLTVDASFPERMAKMYGDLVRVLDKDAHPLAGKTFEGAVEWLTLTNIPTWRGFQFNIKDYDSQTTAPGKSLSDWNKLALFGTIGRPLSYIEVTEIGRGTVTEIEDVKGAFSPMQPFVHMLLPENGTGAMSIVQQHLQSNVANQSTFRYTTRLSLLNEICSILDYQFYCSPYGDLVFEFPHYNALPTDFGVIFRGAYTVAAEMRTCRIASEIGEMNTAWVLEGFAPDKGLEQVTENAVAKNLFEKYVIVAPMLVRRVGARVKYIKVDMPGVGSALGNIPDKGKELPSIRQLVAYAYLQIQRELGHSESVDVEHNYRPYLLPNRPIWVVPRQRIGLVKTVNYSVDVYKGLGTAKTELGYIRSMYRDGSFRNVAGGWRSTVDYAGIFAGYQPKVKFGADANNKNSPDGAASIQKLNQVFSEDYGWATKGNMNGIFCTPAVGTQAVVIDPTGRGENMTRYPARTPYSGTEGNGPKAETTGTGVREVTEKHFDPATRYTDKKTIEIKEMMAKKNILTGPRTFSKRDWKKIRAVMIHCTGAENKDAVVKNAAARAHNYHFIVSLEGNVYKAHDPQEMVWHGHGLSLNSIGIELVGSFAGVMQGHNGKPYFWAKYVRTPTIPTKLQAEALRKLVRELATLLREKGSSLQYIYAHRQSAGSRESDPGELPWNNIVTGLQSELGLVKTTELFKPDTGDSSEMFGGQPIPKEWDPDAMTNFFDGRKGQAALVRRKADEIKAEMVRIAQAMAAALATISSPSANKFSSAANTSVYLQLNKKFVNLQSQLSALAVYGVT